MPKEFALKMDGDDRGVRTHAPEEMAALTPRLRPLGQVTDATIFIGGKVRVDRDLSFLLG